MVKDKIESNFVHIS